MNHLVPLNVYLDKSFSSQALALHNSKQDWACVPLDHPEMSSYVDKVLPGLTIKDKVAAIWALSLPYLLEPFYGIFSNLPKNYKESIDAHNYGITRLVFLSADSVSYLNKEEFSLLLRTCRHVQEICFYELPYENNMNGVEDSCPSLKKVIINDFLKKVPFWLESWKKADGNSFEITFLD